MLYLSRWKMSAQELCFNCGCASFVSYLLGTSLSWLMAVVYLPESTLAITVFVIFVLLIVLIGALYLLSTN